MPAKQPAALPDDCLSLIASHCNADTLRNFRLASSTASRICSPYLFSSVRLVPNGDCLSSFARLFRYSSTRLSIRTFIYDISWEQTILDIRARRHQIVPNPNADSYATSNTNWCQKVDVEKLDHIYSTALCDRNGNDINDEQEDIRNVLRVLPFLDSLVVIPDSYDYQRPIPPFYRPLFASVDLHKARTNILSHLEPHTDHSRHFHSIIIASTTCEDTTFLRLQLRDTRWTTITGDAKLIRSIANEKGPSLWQSAFKTLTTLDLSFRASASRQALEISKSIRLFMKAFEKLETLRLSFSEHVSRCYLPNHRICSSLAPLLSHKLSVKPLLPSLRSLSLSNATVSVQDLVKFLSIHDTTLRSLRLKNIFLMRHESLQDRKPCWVQIINFIKYHLALTEIKFAGWLHNGGRQKWFVSENPAEHGRIRPSVQKYILDENETVCPLDRVSIKPGHEDVCKPLAGSDEFEGDWTWSMTYPSSRQRHVSEQLYSGDDFFSKVVNLDHKPYEAWNTVCHAGQWLGSTSPQTSSSNWSPSYQQPPVKKFKTVHSPSDGQSPSSIWSSSPEPSDSSASSLYEPFAATSKKSSSAFPPVSSAYIMPHWPMDHPQTPLAHAAQGGPQPSSWTFGSYGTPPPQLSSANYQKLPQSTGGPSQPAKAPIVSWMGSGSGAVPQQPAGSWQLWDKATVAGFKPLTQSSDAFHGPAPVAEAVNMSDQAVVVNTSKSNTISGYAPSSQWNVDDAGAPSTYWQAFQPPPSFYENNLGTCWPHTGTANTKSSGAWQEGSSSGTNSQSTWPNASSSHPPLVEPGAQSFHFDWPASDGEDYSAW